MIILSEISQKEKDKYLMTYNTYMWNLKYGTNEPTYKTGKTHRHGEQIYSCQGGGGGSGMDGEFGVAGCQLLPLEWVGPGALLNSTGKGE